MSNVLRPPKRRPVAARHGIEFLRALRDGELPAPPMQRLLGFRLVEVDIGRALFAVLPRERHYNPVGVVHSGLAATMLDSAMGAAVHSLLDEGRSAAIVESKLTLIRPITTATGEIYAEGTVVHCGSRIGTALGRLTDGDDTLLAHASATCVV